MAQIVQPEIGEDANHLGDIWRIKAIIRLILMVL
jgi:hypothetical protein